MSEPILSIGIIFKNDIRCIERCLKSLGPLRKALPCQLVMADTGSTDGSRAVAEQYADILIDFPWVNDFAAARNAVLDRCTGLWCLTVDSDEWLDPNVSELVDFLKGKYRGEFDAGSVIQRNYTDAGLKEFSDFFAMRMARRFGGVLRYQGAIHETLVCAGRDLLDRHIVLARTVLHHDGYAEVSPGHKREKARRNMTLLRPALAQQPEDLRLLGLCIDSSETAGEARSYADRLYDLLLREAGQEPRVGRILAYQKCMKVYYNARDLDRVLECYNAWKAYSPESALLRLDGETFAAVAAYYKNDYLAALEHIENRRKALAEIDSRADLRRQDRLYSQYITSCGHWHSNVVAIAFHCLCELGRFEEADRLLAGVRPEKLIAKDRGFIEQKVFKQLLQLPAAAAFLGCCWQLCQDEAAWQEREEDVSREQALHDLNALLQSYLESAGPEGWALLAGMGDTAPGRSGRILQTDDGKTIVREWAQVTDWGQMFPQAYLHTLELRQPLPENFYRQNAEQLAALAAGLAKQPALPRAALDWLAHTDPPATPGRLAWQLDLATAALRAPGWSGDVAVGQGLCAQYAALSATWLDNVYNPGLLNAEDIAVLPGMHRFAWHLRQALAALEWGDELGYVRCLRAALDTAPAMKEMVDFLLEHKPKTAAQRQLEELAAQVRAVLARYAPDDPAVQTIKASEAYRKVAPLLEETRPAPAPGQEAAASPKPLEEALAGSREEIAASVRKDLARWGGEGEKLRADYWQKYPLWGKDETEVTENIAAALAQHGQEFRWLFGRLGDEVSRRVLTAVVRSWRFYDIDALEKVKDHLYDDYFDLSLLRCDENEVVADLGAYTGDTFLSYVKNYGSMAYRRYYCYEISADSFRALCKTTAPYIRVRPRRKGAGVAPGSMTLAVGADSSANFLAAVEGQETVEIVPLDQDITEPLTLIKMDIEGMEQAALQGCERHIRQDWPKLALSVYHNFEDIWKLPRMIDGMVPGYRFYLRCHGNNAWPTEITLLALPPEKQ